MKDLLNWFKHENYFLFFILFLLATIIFSILAILQDIIFAKMVIQLSDSISEIH